MTREQAAGLFALLRAAYPRTKIGDDTADLWLDELAKLDHPIGEQAVRSVMASVRGWPSLAHLGDQVEVVREQLRRKRQEAERRAEVLADEEMPRPPLRDIPVVVEFLERMRIGVAPTLERASDGPCEDKCGRTGERCWLGRVRVCAKCARYRLNAAGQAIDSDGEAA